MSKRMMMAGIVRAKAKCLFFCLNVINIVATKDIPRMRRNSKPKLSFWRLVGGPSVGSVLLRVMMLESSSDPMRLVGEVVFPLA